MTTFACGNIYIRTNDPMKAGQQVDGHAHNFDHATFVSAGAFRIHRGTEVIEVRAGELPVLIAAGVEHTLIALEDNSVYLCIYSHRLPQGDVVQRYTGWIDAYC